MPTVDEHAEWRQRVTDAYPRRAMAQVFLTSPEYLARFGG
jgi:hypothetical protein